jgi:Protein of unknown function (DUF3011)
MKLVLASLGTLAAFGCFTGSAMAQSTVECHSRNYQYTECQAPLRAPQLVHQISSSACIVNKTWGFNPRTRYVWVAQGCSGVFADPGGYHYGRSGNYDNGARSYDGRGHDAGAIVGAALAGAILGAALDGKSDRKHTTTNDYYYVKGNQRRPSGYDGCHGVGCLVDNPDAARDTSQDVDSSVQKFDKDGNPNYDTEGNYQGCNGLGCTVDNPDAQDDGTNP